MLMRGRLGGVALGHAVQAPPSTQSHSLRKSKSRSHFGPRLCRPAPRTGAPCVSEAAVEDFRVEEQEFGRLEDATEKAPWWHSPHDGQILRLALPALMANLILPISNTVDAAVVGRLGAAQFAGVGMGVLTTTVLSSCFFFISTLMGPFVARKSAEGKKEQISAYVVDSLWFGLLFGGALMLVVLSRAYVIIDMFAPAMEIRPFAVAYLKMSAWLLPGAFWLQSLSGVFRGLKDSVTVLKCSFLAAVVNGVLDVVFVFGFGWSVSGAALATVLSMYASTAIMFLKLLSEGVLNKKVLCTLPRLSVILSLLSNGLQLSLRSLLLLGMVTTGSVLTSRSGTVISATFEICRQMTLITFISYFTLEQTVQALSASCLGRKDKKSAREIIERIMQHAFGLTVVIVILLLTFLDQFAALFTSNPDVVAQFTQIAPLILLSTPFSAVVSVAEGALIGAGRVRQTASLQSIGCALGIVTLLALYSCSQLTVLTTWLVIRTGISLSGFFTAPYLFSTKRSPYGYQLLP